MAQEVTKDGIQKIRGYTSYLNIGTTNRGTAFIVKEPLTLYDISQLPSGRGIIAKCQGVWFVNIYAPSGSARKKEREDFFNKDVAFLLRDIPTPIILGGDFNCVLEPSDCTGYFNRSGNLRNLVEGFGLIDAWQPTANRHTYTHYTYHGAARLDRFYITRDLQKKKLVRRPSSFPLRTTLQ